LKGLGAGVCGDCADCSGSIPPSDAIRKNTDNDGGFRASNNDS